MTVEYYLQRAAECVRLAADTTLKPIKKALEETAVLWRKQAADSALRGDSANDRHVERAMDDVEDMSAELMARVNDNRAPQH